MSDDELREQPKGPETEWQRKRRLAEIFGDAEPERPSESAGDRWLREQVPPHHG